MKELQLVLYDDLHAARGERVAANSSHVLSLDGETVELDLSAEHSYELKTLLTPYLEAGSKPDTVASGRPGMGESRSEKGREYYRQMREFADASNGRYRYRSASKGGHYYSRELRRAFDKHLRETQS